MNTTGAPSTNPPAVIGRDLESLMGAWAPPVAIPEFPAGRGGGGCACGFPSPGSWQVAGGVDSAVQKNERATMARPRGRRMGGNSMQSWKHKKECQRLSI